MRLRYFQIKMVTELRGDSDIGDKNFVVILIVPASVESILRPPCVYLQYSVYRMLMPSSV